MSIALCLALCACTAELDLVSGDGGPWTDAGPAGASDFQHHVDVGPATQADPCPENAKKIFLLDKTGGGKLVRFDPLQKAFTPIGHLDCGNNSHPWSMSVTRDGIAHVLFADGAIFEVDTEDASCKPTPHTHNTNCVNKYDNCYVTFGMGYSTDGAGTHDETLFVANDQSLGALDTKSWIIKSIAPLDRRPELTGNSLGQLWGFFPRGSSTEPDSHISRIDKDSGAELETMVLPDLGIVTIGYAFARWGGEFFVFAGRSNSPSSNVYRVNGDSGEMEDWVIDTGLNIVGAGVSTCAPIVLQ